jgi:hypothetical protein
MDKIKEQFDANTKSAQK